MQSNVMNIRPHVKSPSAVLRRYNSGDFFKLEFLCKDRRSYIKCIVEESVSVSNDELQRLMESQVRFQIWDEKETLHAVHCSRSST